MFPPLPPPSRWGGFYSPPPRWVGESRPVDFVLDPGHLSFWEPTASKSATSVRDAGLIDQDVCRSSRSVFDLRERVAHPFIHLPPPVPSPMGMPWASCQDGLVERCIFEVAGMLLVPNSLGSSATLPPPYRAP
jgi:hypothetical protein